MTIKKSIRVNKKYHGSKGLYHVLLDKNLQIYDIKSIEEGTRPVKVYEKVKGHPFNEEEIKNLLVEEGYEVQ